MLGFGFQNHALASMPRASMWHPKGLSGLFFVENMVGKGLSVIALCLHVFLVGETYEPSRASISSHVGPVSILELSIGAACVQVGTVVAVDSVWLCSSCADRRCRCRRRSQQPLVVGSRAVVANCTVVDVLVDVLVEVDVVVSLSLSMKQCTVSFSKHVGGRDVSSHQVG